MDRGVEVKVNRGFPREPGDPRRGLPSVDRLARDLGQALAEEQHAEDPDHEDLAHPDVFEDREHGRPV